VPLSVYASKINQIAVPTLALIGQKGGVGRTTVAVNLSYSLARRGWRVLLVDADLQGGVGFSLTEKSKDATGFHDFLTGLTPVTPATLGEALIHTKLPGLSLLTRGSRAALDRVLGDANGSLLTFDRIRELERTLSGLDFDLVVFDCPTGLNPVSTGLARAVDALVIPQQPGPLCLRSLPQVLRMVASARSANPETDQPRLVGFLLTMTDPDDPASLNDQREFRDLLPLDLVMETVIPAHRDFRDACRVGVPVAMLRERPSPSALIFDQLAAELELRLNLFEDGQDPTSNQNDYARLVD